MSEQTPQDGRPFAHAGGTPTMKCKHCGGKGFITWDLTTMGDRIRYAREQRGLSLDEVANSSGIHASNLKRYEDNVNEPKVSTLRVIAKAMGVSVGFLAGD